MTENFGRVDLFLDDLAEITRLMEEIDPKETVTIECAGWELSAHELRQLEGKRATEALLFAPGLMIGFSPHAALARVKELPANLGAVSQIRRYIAKHCRQPLLRRNLLADMTCLVLLWLPFYALIFWLEAHSRVGRWAEAIPMVAIWVVILSTRRHKARIFLIPRSKHRSWWDRHETSTVSVITAVIVAILTLWITHVWK